MDSNTDTLAIDVAGPALVPDGLASPMAGDAKAWLDRFLAARAAGPSREELSRLVRDPWALAQRVTHGNLGRVAACAMAQSTVFVVRTLHELTLRAGSNETVAGRKNSGLLHKCRSHT